MPSLPERPRTSQEALLQLEKGTASPTIQLNEAAQIIGLDLSLCASHPKINRAPHVPTHTAPKEEWVLRWLLKKLKAGKNYRVEPASFLLLRQLIDLIPLKTLASTLKDQKFLGLLDHAITDLTDDVLAGLGDGANELLSSDSESSRTLSESSRADATSDKKGTKRKRASGNGQGAMNVDNQPRTPASCFLTFTRLLDCLYSLVALANRAAGVSEVASSHLRHALRGEPQPVATTLGKSFTLASFAISQFRHGHKTTELQHLFYVLPAVLEVWEWRSHRQDGSDQSSSNESFVTHCSQRALRLVHCVRATQLHTDERDHVLNGVERSIALHVVLPARADFFSRGGSGIDYSANEPDWSSVKPISDTLRPILCSAEVSTQTGATTNQDGAPKKGFWNTPELIPEFFEIASRSVPRDSFRRKTDEAPWLETLFVAVAELAFSLVKSEGTPTFLPNFVEILEQLFRVALTRNVQLSLHTLLTHAAYTGILKDELSQVEWSLTALLIELGVDIFLPNSGLADSNKYLGSLLDKVILHWRSGTSTNGSYELIKSGIILPLLRGFTGARDLATFMEIWYQQLTNIEEARMQDSKLDLLTVWEDDDLCNAYSELMRNPLNQNLAVAQMRAAATEICGDDDKMNASAETYGQVVIIESGFRKRTVNLADANADLKSVIETVKSTLSSDRTLHWRWRLWKLARSLIENNVQRTDAGLGGVLPSLTGVAAKSIQRHHSDLTQLSTRLECITAYQFILAIIKHSPEISNGGEFSSLIKEVTKLIQTISAKDALQSMSSPWNGRSETIDSPAVLCLAYFITLVRSPEVWASIEPKERRPLFTHLLSLTTAQYQSSSSSLETLSSGARFLQVWASIVSHEYLLTAPSIVNDLIAVLSERVKEDASNRKLYIESLQRIPAPLITRRQRGALLDLLQSVISQPDNTSTITVRILSLMAKLADMPKSTAELTGNWEPIWTLAKAITLQGTDLDLEIMKSYRFLHRAVVTKLLLLAEGDRRKLFKKMYRKISAKVSKLQSIDRNSMECLFLRISLYQFWFYRERLGDAIDVNELTATREKLFELVVADVRSVKDQFKKQPLEETITLIKTLDALEDFEDLATNHGEVRKFLFKIENYVEESVDSESSLRRLIRRRVLATQGPEKSVTAPMVQYAESLPLQQMYSEEQQLFIRATNDRFRSMSTDALLKVVQDIRQLGFAGKNGEYHLLIAGLAVSAVASTEDKDGDQAKELSLVCTAITEALPRSKNLEEFVLATECLDVFLRSHPRCISQWNVDSLLSCIAVCASRAGPQINPEFSGTIYIRLCRVMGLLLGLHRQKLGGRFHLILPAMQRLLHCLFVRAKKRSRLAKSDTGHGQQPYWLSQLSATHATQFTRLLTSLCDPTVSAVSRPTPWGAGYEGLTDQTKKAKRIAGQYLQYLVMDYAQSSLRSALYPDVKAALMPGLYSVLDVMSRDTMRALNAGLDVSGRAMFKALYDDYMKFGRWNKG
ncbi:Urb2/Npa2 family-domain-containing protein [Aspergillus cavernicola]|uniref:Urb2/Npa2 family-domain-containing protein n=1 Tax=Aspergillus cavernicola TaxID=176166 RepID=A0ABR4IIS4_9EURO